MSIEAHVEAYFYTGYLEFNFCIMNFIMFPFSKGILYVVIVRFYSNNCIKVFCKFWNNWLISCSTWEITKSAEVWSVRYMQYHWLQYMSPNRIHTCLGRLSSGHAYSLYKPERITPMDSAEYYKGISMEQG